VSANTEIGWTDHTWPVIRGCSKVSDGCKFCWAIRDAHLHAGNKNPKMQEHFGGLTVLENGRPNWTGIVRLDESILNWPLRWKKPARIFAASSGDLFHENLPDQAIDRVFAVMALCPQHTFQVLTKRAARMPEYFQTVPLGGHDGANCSRQARVAIQQSRVMADIGLGQPTLKWPLPNVWLGVSVEDQANKYRIDLLRQTPAAVRFVSIEPLLEDIGKLDLTGIHWIIVGGESGPGARPFDVEWARSIIRQCEAVGVPVFVKQLGRRPIKRMSSGIREWTDPVYLTDRQGANMSDWPESIRVREFPR
jgi:protein gp37